MKFTCSVETLYEAISRNKEYLINVLRKYIPHLSMHNIDDFLYKIEEYRYIKDNKKVKNRIYEAFINDFNHASFDMKRYEIDGRKIVHSGSYDLPSTPGKLHSVSDIPHLAQIVNNHFKIYLNSDINFFSTICKFRTLLVRDDNVALVYINSISSKEMICEPPHHELDGLTLTSINTHPFTNSKYMSLCVVDLSNKWIQKGFYDSFEEFFNKQDQDECCDDDKESDALESINSCKEKYTLLVDAGFYC